MLFVKSLKYLSVVRATSSFQSYMEYEAHAASTVIWTQCSMLRLVTSRSRAPSVSVATHVARSNLPDAASKLRWPLLSPSPENKCLILKSGLTSRFSAATQQLIVWFYVLLHHDLGRLNFGVNRAINVFLLFSAWVSNLLTFVINHTYTCMCKTHCYRHYVTATAIQYNLYFGNWHKN